MNLRQLKKQDKRAAAILIAIPCFRAYSENFGLNDDGRYHYWWRDSYEYNEWDSQPASDYLSEREFDEWFFEHCLDNQGEVLPDDKRPPCPPSAMRKLPAGYRWRGRRVVRVGKHGEMIAPPVAKEG